VLLGIPVLYWLLRRQRHQPTGPAQT
jgi:hypothetical protein